MNATILSRHSTVIYLCNCDYIRVKSTAPYAVTYFSPGLQRGRERENQPLVLVLIFSSCLSLSSVSAVLTFFAAPLGPATRGAVARGDACLEEECQEDETKGQTNLCTGERRIILLLLLLLLVFLAPFFL